MQCASDFDCGWHASCGAENICTVFPLGTNPLVDGLMGITAFTIAGISLAAGVGGGGLFVPLLMGILSFDTAIATALSQSMLIGGAMAAFAYNLTHKHPRVPQRPLVDYELACLLGPALMAGAQIGSVIHAAAPPAILLFVLILVLLDAAKKGLQNAWKIRAAEKEKAAQTAQADDVGKPLASSQESGDESSSAMTESDLEEAQYRIRDAQMKLFFVWVFCVIVTLTKGLAFDICAPGWWGCVAITALGLGSFSIYYAGQLSEREPVDDHSLDFRELAFTLVKWSLIAGAIAALCGIGGGMIMGPILVGLKVPPPVSAATTATTLLVLSSTTALVYICRGIAPRDYSIYLCTVTVCGAFSGKVLIGRWVRRTGKESVIVWCLAGITVASVLLMGTLGSLRVYQRGWDSVHVGDICHPAGIPAPGNLLEGPNATNYSAFALDA